MVLLRENDVYRVVVSQRVLQEPAEVFAHLRLAEQVEERAVPRDTYFLLESENSR